MDRKCKDCEYYNCGHYSEGTCNVCYGHCNWVPKYSYKEEKEMKKYQINMQMTVDFRTMVDAQDAKDAKEQAIRLRNKVVFGIDNSNDMTPGGYNGCSKYGSVWDCRAASMSTNEISTKKPLILLCGKSGSGKTTVADLLCRKYGLKQLDSCTTRPPRKDGESGHIFTSLNLFNQHIMDNKVIAQADINGYKYWATKDQLDSADIYVIDPKTALELEKKVKDEREVIIVYLYCSDTTRVYRMTKRGDSLEDIKKRLQTEQPGLGHVNWDDYIEGCYAGQITLDADTPSSEELVGAIYRIWNHLKEKCK